METTELDKVRILSKKEKGQNRHWKNFLDKDYLGSHNLEKNEEMLLTIAGFIGEEEVCTTDGIKSKKPVIYFKEEVPKMIMNITNGNTISALYGSHPEGWIGKQIRVYATAVKAFGKTQDALRIRDFIPKIEVDVVAISEDMEGCKTLAELQAYWRKLPVSARNTQELVDLKDKLKTKLK